MSDLQPIEPEPGEPLSGVPETPRFVVGIGASAGGLDPLVRFFDHLPQDTGMAFVIVQHLSPDFRSLMDELLARHTALPIALVENGMPVAPNHVYLIPAKKEMIMSGGRLLLSERDRQQELTLPIDVFFRSLAQDRGADAVAIVLSGGGSDGSRGIRDVKEAGGLVLVQDQESAQFDGMPRAAIESGAASGVMPPHEMPRALVAHAAERAALPIAPRPAPDSLGLGLDAVYKMLQERFGIDFTHYKPSTITRRIDRRLALAQSSNLEEYLARVRDDATELDALYHDLLIGVTRFFRDPAAFDLLEQRVLPELIGRATKETPLRLWVAGCATGEEAYSLAIVVQDVMARMGERPVKIFATDVHRGSLEQAALAVYDEGAVANVSPERLARYFTRTGRSYQVVPELRQHIVFAQHNVIRDAPFTRIDLVTCRNLLIYLQPPAQQKVLSFFHFSLAQNGVLLLGPSETLGPWAHGFEILDKHWQLYRKHTDVRTPVESRRLVPGPSPRASEPLPVPVPRHSLGQLLGTYDVLLDEAMPPSLLLNEYGDLVHVFGGAGRFLKVRDGRQGLHVLDLVDGELKMVLTGALRRTQTEPDGLVFAGVKAGRDGDESLYRVTVRVVRGRASSSPHVVVSLEPSEGQRRRLSPAETLVQLDQLSQQQVSLLEAELGYTRENLQAAIEQLEASNEELQASNEELQASNEELQSTNEELQSVNEELYTVNAEYQRKISELTELTNDMDNLLAATEIGTIFLDGQLRIRKFTPQIAETFALVPHDVGRPIETFAHKMDHPELVDDLRRALSTGQPVERDLLDLKGRSFYLRVLPYRVKGMADGVVLTMIDVSGLKAAEDALFHERYLLNSLLGSVPDAIYFKDARGRYIRANHAMAVRLGLDAPADAVGRTALDVPNREIAIALGREDDDVLVSGKVQHYQLEQGLAPDGEEAWHVVTRLPLLDRERRVVGVIVIVRDVTAEKAAERKIQEEVTRRDQFLAMLSHELRNPLGAIVTAGALLRTDPSGRPEIHRAVDVLERQSQQMARLLDDLLEASRVTQNKIELRRRVVDLRDVAREAADAVRGSMEAQGVRFRMDIDDQPVLVDGDPARLQQIQVNLLSNATKYTPAGGHVHLAVRREGGDAVVRVSDDGMGIPPGMLESVFDLFVQSARTLDRSAGGLGVGLTLVKALVEMHGGSVAASSGGEGQGAEFVARLPLTAGQVAAPPPASPAEPRERVSRVVVVEDNPDSRELLCVLLEREGYECQTAADGAEALDLVRAFRPEVVILDVGLPEIDGFEVARRLRADAELTGTRLIAVTGYGQESDRAAAREAGFDAHLVKPVQTDQLLALLGGPAPAKVPTVVP